MVKNDDGILHKKQRYTIKIKRRYIILLIIIVIIILFFLFFPNAMDIFNPPLTDGG